MSEKQTNEARWTIDEIVAHVVVFGMTVSVFVQAAAEAYHWLKFGEWLNWSVADQFPGLIVEIERIQWVGLRRILTWFAAGWVSFPFAVAGTILSYRLRGFR